MLTNLQKLSHLAKVTDYHDDIAKEDANKALALKKVEHRALIRKCKHKEDMHQNEKLLTLISSKPGSAFKFIKSSRPSSTLQVPYISVGDKKYAGDRVIDGLYESILKLKTIQSDVLEASPLNAELQADYKHIKDLCANKTDLPPISMTVSSDILNRIKPAVSDFFSITANHFINAGTAGYIRFNLLLNIFIIQVNNCSIEELNSVYALLLYKGHNKDRTLDSSYRTISTCPLLAKGLDLYVRDLSIIKWNSQQADTQYQGEGTSHELALLFLTEAIQHSKFSNKLPIFLLFLDAYCKDQTEENE